jgi:hypothetical protein
MASLLSPLLWSFIPAQLTTTLLPHLSTHLPALFPPSPARTPQYAKNYRNVYTLLIAGYLAYTLLQHDTTRGEDLYALLGVSRTVDDEGLKRAFRALSRRYHPDRAGESGGGVFILVRQAYEVLSDPIRRYAYDRWANLELGGSAASADVQLWARHDRVEEQDGPGVRVQRPLAFRRVLHRLGGLYAIAQV